MYNENRGTNCGKYFSDEAGAQEIAKDSWIIAAKGHTMTAHAAAEETCTTPGNTAYWECTDCGEYFSDEKGAQEIAKDSWVIAAQHNYQLQNTVTADCTSDGTEHFVCARCDCFGMVSPFWGRYTPAYAFAKRGGTGRKRARRQPVRR